MSIAVSPRIDEVPEGGPVPGEFAVCLGPDSVTEALDVGMAELMHTWIEWVEMEVQDFEDLMEGLCRLRGAFIVLVTWGCSPR